MVLEANPKTAKPEPAPAEITRMVAELRRLSPDDLAWYRGEIAIAAEDDPHLPIDRAALAIFDAQPEPVPAGGNEGWL